MDEIRIRAMAAHRERDRLHSLAHTDALTGLLNRRGLQDALEALLRTATLQGACRIGLTIGFACAPCDGQDLAELLKRADAATYAGKQAGRNRVQCGDPSAALAAG